MKLNGFLEVINIMTYSRKKFEDFKIYRVCHEFFFYKITLQIQIVSKITHK